MAAGSRCDRRGGAAALFAYVAANMFTDYFNHYARTELDIPAAPGIAA
jgi:hypothetical protein